jgi:hypothetical protein
MEKMQQSLSRKSDTAGAIGYALSHWRALTRYVDDGLLEIDNSARGTGAPRGLDRTEELLVLWCRFGR